MDLLEPIEHLLIFWIDLLDKYQLYRLQKKYPIDSYWQNETTIYKVSGHAAPGHLSLQNLHTKEHIIYVVGKNLKRVSDEDLPLIILSSI